MAIRIVDVKLVPQTVNVGAEVDIEIKVSENNWQTIKVDFVDWLEVKDRFNDWQEVKNY